MSGVPMHVAREERLAATLAARAAAPPDLTPRCTVSGCASHLHRAGRCLRHWRPLRDLVAGMAGVRGGSTISRPAFSDAMHAAGITLDEWRSFEGRSVEDPEVDDAFDRWTDDLYAAGYYIRLGPRGGRRLARRVR